MARENLLHYPEFIGGIIMVRFRDFFSFGLFLILTSSVNSEAKTRNTSRVSRLPDLIVSSITMSPAQPKAGDKVIFSAVVKNQGQGATPAGVIIGVAFSVDGQVLTWSDTDTTSLAAGASVKLTANSGAAGYAYYIATSGTHTLGAYVNDVNRFSESNANNNKLSISMKVTAAATPTPTVTPTPTPKPTATPTPAPTATPSPTSTPVAGSVSVSSLTANNTSASILFTDIYKNYVTGTIGTSGKPTTNGDALPMNVSNVSVHTLMPKHPDLSIIVETQSWFCHNASNEKNGVMASNATCNGALDIGYNSDTNAAAQVDDMVRRGIDGAAINWYGPGTIGDGALTNMFSRSENAYGGKFKVTVDIDKGAFQEAGSPCAGKNPTNMATCFLDYIDGKFGNSPAMMKINGKKAIYWFILEQDIDSQIDWATVKAKANSLNMVMIIDNPGGYTFYNNGGFSDGAYAWVGNDINSFYSTAKQYSSKITVGGVWRGFNDVAAGWTSNFIIPSRCGQLWLDNFALNDAKSGASAIMIGTWDDYAEGSEIETGIDNCLSSVSASISGGNLTWTSNFGVDPWSGYLGTEATVDHYEIWISADGGKTASLAAQVAPKGTGSGSIAVSSLNLPSGSYKAYVRAVGKPSIQNHTSAAVSL